MDDLEACHDAYYGYDKPHGSQIFEFKGESRRIKLRPMLVVGLLRRRMIRVLPPMDDGIERYSFTGNRGWRWLKRAIDNDEYSVWRHDMVQRGWLPAKPAPDPKPQLVTP